MSKAWDALTPEMQKDIAEGPYRALKPYTIESIIDRCTPRGPFPNSNIVATYRVREAALKALRESELELAKAVRLAFEGDLGALFAARNAVLKEKAKAGEPPASSADGLDTSCMDASQCKPRFPLPVGSVFLGRITGTGHAEFAFDHDVSATSNGGGLAFATEGKCHQSTQTPPSLRRQWAKDGNKRTGLYGKRVQAVNHLAVKLYDAHFFQAGSNHFKTEHPRWPLPDSWVYLGRCGPTPASDVYDVATDKDGKLLSIAGTVDGITYRHASSSITTIAVDVRRAWSRNGEDDFASCVNYQAVALYDAWRARRQSQSSQSNQPSQPK